MPKSEFLEVARQFRHKVLKYPLAWGDESVAEFAELAVRAAIRGLIGAEGTLLDAEQRSTTRAQIASRMMQEMESEKGGAH